MGIFNRGKDKKDKLAKNLAEEITHEREKVLNVFNNCILAFENSYKKNFSSEDMFYYNKTLTLLKLSLNMLKDITISVNAAELSYLYNIAQKIAQLNDGVNGNFSIGTTSSAGSRLEGTSEKKAKDIYAIVWQWLHL